MTKKQHRDKLSAALDEHKEKLPQEVVADVQAHIDATKKALEGGNLDEIKAAKQNLEQHMQKIGEAMQQAAGVAAGPGPNSQPHEQAAGSQTATPNDDIEEAEVEILDDEDKA